MSTLSQKSPGYSSGAFLDALYDYDFGSNGDAKWNPLLSDRALALGLLIVQLIANDAAAQNAGDATRLFRQALQSEQQGRLLDAEHFYKNSLSLYETELGLTHPDVAAVLNQLGILYVAQRRFLEAEPLYRGAIEILERSRSVPTRSGGCTAESRNSLCGTGAL